MKNEIDDFIENQKRLENEIKMSFEENQSLTNEKNDLSETLRTKEKNLSKVMELNIDLQKNQFQIKKLNTSSELHPGNNILKKISILKICSNRILKKINIC